MYVIPPIPDVIILILFIKIPPKNVLTVRSASYVITTILRFFFSLLYVNISVLVVVIDSSPSFLLFFSKQIKE